MLYTFPHYFEKNIIIVIKRPEGRNSMLVINLIQYEMLFKRSNNTWFCWQL